MFATHCRESRRDRLALLGFAAAALAGCVSYEAVPLSPEQSASAVGSRSLDDPGLRDFLEEEEAGTGPWNVNRLALAAAYFFPEVVVARAQEAEAMAAVKTAGQRPNPVFTFGPQFASNRATYTPWFLAGNVAIPFETAGKRDRRIEQAVSAAEAARWRVSSQAWAARTRVRSAMLDLHAARENLRLLEVEQGLHEEAIKKLTAQMEAGDVSPFELTQARLALNRARLALQDAKRNESTGEAKLAAAVGVPVSALHSVTLDLGGFQRLPDVDKSESRRRALTQRADLMALLADYAVAEAALRLEIARQYPDFNLKPGYDYNSGQNRWQLGWSVELPLNGNRGPIAEAEARRQSAATAFLARQTAIQGELDIALADYEASRTKAMTAEQLAREAKTAAETTRRMVDAGEVSALEHTRRQIEASAADVALLAAKLEAQAAAGSIALTLPFALIGGVMAAWLSGGVLSLGSLVGFVTVLGIAARNGILLVSHYRHLEREEGCPFDLNLVLRGSEERLIPILMTAATAALALLPLVLKGDVPGNEIERPLALVILGGLITSTTLNLFLLPALYARFGWIGKPSSRESLEP